jgi:hypothetical protein
MDGHGRNAHQRYEEMAVAHVLGGLDQSDGVIFRTHLVDCSNCRARVGELRALAHDLADVERDERRVRATKAVETKRRERGEDGVPDEPPEALFRPRLMTVIGIAAILALAAWNFTLRGTVERFGREIDRRVDAAAALEFGTAGEVLEVARGVRGQAKTDRGSLVLLVDGLSDGQVYGLYLLDSADKPVFWTAVTPREGRLFSLVDFPEGSERVLLTQSENPPGAEPDGETVFSASLIPAIPPNPSVSPSVSG